MLEMVYGGRWCDLLIIDYFCDFIFRNRESLREILKDILI